MCLFVPISLLLYILFVSLMNIVNGYLEILYDYLDRMCDCCLIACSEGQLKWWRVYPRLFATYLSREVNYDVYFIRYILCWIFYKHTFIYSAFSGSFDTNENCNFQVQTHSYTQKHRWMVYYMWACRAQSLE